MRNWPRLLLYAFGPLLALLLACFCPKVPQRPIPAATVRDMTGAQVPLKAPARKCMIFPPLLWDYVTIENGCSHIQSAAPFSVTEISSGLLASVFPDVGRLSRAPTVMSTAIPGDPELVLRADPDLIVCWAWFTGGLDKLGLPVMRVKLPSGKGNRDVFATWFTLGEAAAQGDRVAWLLTRYETQMKKIAVRVGNPTARPSCLYVYRRSDGLLYVAHKNTRENELIRLAGGRNAGGELLGSVIGYEQLLRMAPDFVFIAGYDSGDAVTTFCSEAAFESIPAVRNHRVYRQPRGGSRMGGLVEEPLFVAWMAELLNPGTPACLRDDFRESYRTVYDTELDDETLDQTLNLEENRGAAGIARFTRTGRAR